MFVCASRITYGVPQRSIVYVGSALYFLYFIAIVRMQYISLQPRTPDAVLYRPTTRTFRDLQASWFENIINQIL